MPAIAAVNAANDEALDRQMFDKLVTLPAARTLAFDQVTSLYRARPDSVKAKVRSAVETLSKPPADVEAKLDELLGKLKSGDATRGFQVFRSAKAACSACHRIGYVGGTIGPELTRIGATRSRRALLEAIVFPNARLEQSYTPVRILTGDGLVLNGLVVKETATNSNWLQVPINASLSQLAILNSGNPAKYRSCPQAWSNNYRSTTWQIC